MPIYQLIYNAARSSIASIGLFLLILLTGLTSSYAQETTDMKAVRADIGKLLGTVAEFARRDAVFFCHTIASLKVQALP